MIERSLSILHVNATDIGGGAERIAGDLVRGCRAAGHRAWLAVGRQRGNDAHTFTIPDDRMGGWTRALIAAADALEPWGRQRQPVRRVRRWLTRVAHPRNYLDWLRGREDFHYPQTARLPDLAPQPIDLIHAHNLHGGFFDLRRLGALSRRLPCVLTLHDEWLLTGHCAYAGACQRWLTGCGACPDLGIYPAIRRDGTARNWQIKAATYRQSQLFVATPSRWLMAQARRSMLAAGIAAARVIPNGVDLDLFRPHDRRAARRRLGLAEDRPLLLAVANRIRHNRFKDWATLQRALTELAHLRPEQEVIFVGLGDEAPDERIGPVTIRFVPFDPDPATIALYYQAADLYLHAAKSENFPTTVLEALACGTPVVATAVGGIPEQIDDIAKPAASGGANGVLVPPGDGVAMAAAVIALLADPPLLTRMGQEARTAAEARFGVERMIAAYLDWYREIAGETGGAPIRSDS